MDLSKMCPKDKQRYKIAEESGSNFIQSLRCGVVPKDFEDIIYMIRRAEYKRGKADGIAELKQAHEMLSSNIQEKKR